MRPEALSRRRNRERAGRRAELVATLWLMLKGYRILDRRAKTPLGEIDIVAAKGALLVFVEVKARTSLEKAFEAVTPALRRRVEGAARVWTGRRPKLNGFNWRFDVIAIAPSSRPRHLQDAWRPET
jgi:putative endonuclease